MFTQSSPEQPLELDLLENFTAAFQDENIMSPGKSDRIHQYVSEQAKLVKPHEEVSDHGNPLEIDPCKDIPCQPGSKRPRRHEKSPKERHKRKSTKEKPQGESNVFAKRLSLMNVSKLINSSRGILAKSKKSKTVRIGKHLIQVYSSSPRKGRDQNDSKTGSLQSFPGKLYEKGSNILDTDCDDCPSQQASDDHQADPIEMSWEEDYNANSVHSAFSRGQAQSRLVETQQVFDIDAWWREEAEEEKVINAKIFDNDLGLERNVPFGRVLASLRHSNLTSIQED